MSKKKRKNINSFISIQIGLFLGFVTYFTSSFNLAKAIAVTIICIVIIEVIIYYKKYKVRVKYLNSGIEIVDKLQGEEFEDFLLAHFQNLGYDAEKTSKTNDYGADLILKKAGKKTVVQAKRWVSKVGIAAIQEVFGAKSYYKADNCIVVSNNYFTPNAINLAKASNVELWDRNKLLDIMGKTNGKDILQHKFDIDNINNRVICQKCGSDMVIKDGKYGRFYGCSKYPRCRNTQKI